MYELTQSVSFTASADNPALFSIQPSVAPDGTLTYAPAPDANGLATITVTAVDDGGTANGGTDTSAPRTFTITLTPVNDEPDLTTAANKTKLEDAGAQSIGGWATAITPGPANESTQIVSFTAAADNPGLFAVQPAIAPDGTLVLHLRPRRQWPRHHHRHCHRRRRHREWRHQHKRSSHLHDHRHARQRRAQPQRRRKQDRTRRRRRSVQRRLGDRDHARPANESTQNVTFTASADDPALFSTQPAVAPDGTLTYTPAADADGLGTITVTAVDDGGTANGGTNTSAPTTLTITLTPVNDAPSFSAGSNHPLSRYSGHKPSQAGRQQSRPGRRTKPPRTSPSPSPTTTRGSSPSNPRCSRRNAHLHANPACAR